MVASSPDKREAIILRLLAIGQELGYASCVRNRGLRTNEERPSIIVMDGDESVARSVMRQTVSRGRASPMAPQIMTMTPEVYIMLKEGRPTNDAVGEELNAKRIVLVAAIAEDTALLDLCGSNGSIILNGCTTDLKSGSAMAGEMRLDFAFTYVFQPTA